MFALCDTITVMRDGSYVADQRDATTTEDEIIKQMVGRSVENLFPKEEATIGEAVLEVEHLTSLGVFEDVSFTVRSGEIVCFAGLVGAGRSEIARAVFGVDRYDSGTVTIGGTRVPAKNPAAAMRLGHGLRPGGSAQAGPGDDGRRADQHHLGRSASASRDSASSPARSRSRAPAPGPHACR